MGVFRLNPPTLFLQPTLVRIRRRLHRCLTCPCQAKSWLLPPPHSHPCPLLHLLCPTQVHNILRNNILYNRIISLPNLGFHWLKPRLISCRLCRGVTPPSFRPPPWHPTRQSPRHLVLKISQKPYHAGGGVNNPVSAPKNSTDWKMFSKKKSYTRGLSPSLIRILDIIHQTARTFVRFWITSGKSSSSANSIITMYLKDGTI